MLPHSFNFTRYIIIQSPPCMCPHYLHPTMFNLYNCISHLIQKCILLRVSCSFRYRVCYHDCILYSPYENLATTRQNQQNECAPSEASNQPGHPPSLIRVFTVHMTKAWVLSYPMSAHRRLWSDWADTQADLSLRWEYSHFVGFFMSRLTSP